MAPAARAVPSFSVGRHLMKKPPTYYHILQSNTVTIVYCQILSTQYYNSILLSNDYLNLITLSQIIFKAQSQVRILSI